MEYEEETLCGQVILFFVTRYDNVYFFPLFELPFEFPNRLHKRRESRYYPRYEGPTNPL